ncbi:hypothetical protein PABG_01242 [Paracoccidioides brasiliensis Pb03]|nr:hypothetical protein PABG_01242 [Paracoccidioides brasiliensis Pb03]
MANCSSFRNHCMMRPSDYHTPSPPRDAVELISPARTPAHSPTSPSSIIRNVPSRDGQQPRYEPFFGDKESSIKHEWNNPFQDGNRTGSQHPHNPQPQPHQQEYHHYRGSSTSHPTANPANKIGQRSGSNIDALATIALATSPTFAPLTYDEPASAGLATTTTTTTKHHQPSTTDQSERPSKRARSEKASSPSWLTRPVTSHISAFDSMKTDAELLLNFARPSNFPRYQDGPKPQLQLQSANQPARPNRRTAAVQWATDPADLWVKKWDITAENKPSSAFFGSNPGGAPSRIRSKSDGSAFMGRPVMNGFVSGSSPLPPLMGHALEDDQVDPRETAEKPHGTMQANHLDVQQKPPTPFQRRNSVPASDLKAEDSDNDSSSQATCASCNLDRIGSDGEDEDSVTWISCDGCNKWFHIVCAGFKSDRDTRTVDKFICRTCRPLHGPTTFVRKSSRARTAIDYAGLNQGFIMSSTETPEHHYIQPIKDGKITFLPDNFARIRPELVTAEYFEKGIGMTEPIVIPASFNTRASVPGSSDYIPPEVATEEELDEIIDNMPADDDDGNYTEVIDCGQDLLDMVIPQGLTVRHVAELYGPEERVEVIDVKSQQGEDKRWNMQKWADYYYDDSASKIVRNVISLEVSNSPLGRLIRRPKIVRDLDLQDHVWPAELQAIGDFPKVQFYVLMSVADCYTDFHIDFGGSSVYYHILKGSKTFFFIPPKDKYLKKYEEWCNSAAQDTTFLGNQTKECYRVDLSAGDTMLIPSGWIHAVWTPEDSLVIGGNFLTRMNYGMQIKVAKIEKDTKVPKKFRYPFFQKILWYAAIKYLEDDPIPQSVLESFSRDENYRFYREYPIYYEFGERGNTAKPGTEYYNARYYSQAELDGLPELAKYLLRTALIAGGYQVDGVTTETRNAVRRSIPKGQGDPVDTIMKFGMWVAWKRGNEPAAKWTRPGAISFDTKVDMSDRKPAGRPSRRSQRNIAAESPQLNANEAKNMTESQTSGRRLSDLSSENTNNGVISSTSSSSTTAPSMSGTPGPPKRKASLSNVKDDISQLASSYSTNNSNNNINKPRLMQKPTGLGPKRVACDACRKRRIRCRHKDEQMLVESFVPVTASMSSKQPINGRVITAVAAAAAAGTFSAVNVDGIKERHAAAVGDAGATVGEDAYAAAASSTSGSLLMTSQPNAGKVKGFSSNSSGAGKKRRSKACDECRKSKRRCIHDENGRIDPVKAQERSKPRATASTKRPPFSEDNLSPSLTKRQKPEFYISGEEPPQAQLDFESVRTEFPMNHMNGENEKPVAVIPMQQEIGPSQTSYASPPTLKADLVPAAELTSIPTTAAPASSLVSPPTSLADDLEVDPNQTDGEEKAPNVKSEQEQQKQNGERSVIAYTSTTASRNPTHQRCAVSDAEAGSCKTATTRTLPTVTVTTEPSDLSVTLPSSSATSISNTLKMPSFTTSSPSTSRWPSSHNRTTTTPPSSSSFKHEREQKQHTPVVDKKRGVAVDEGSNNPPPSPRSHPNQKQDQGQSQNHSQRTSPASPQRHRSKLTSRDRGSFSDADADPDTLRLIREMQEQDFGLRKRPTRT